MSKEKRGKKIKKNEKFKNQMVRISKKKTEGKGR
jgi:hypothetical protein